MLRQHRNEKLKEIAWYWLFAFTLFVLPGILLLFFRKLPFDAVAPFFYLLFWIAFFTINVFGFEKPKERNRFLDKILTDPKKVYKKMKDLNEKYPQTNIIDDETNETRRSEFVRINDWWWKDYR